MASFIPRFLRQLRDIVISSPADGQVLTYDSADQKWKNEAGGGGVLPVWWTVDSTPGSESVVFEGTVEIAPGYDGQVLVLRTNLGSGQTTLPFQFFDEDGDPAVDFDAQGILDARHIVVQNPPNTGADGGSVVLLPQGKIVIQPRNASTTPFEVWDAAITATILQVRASGFGDILEIAPIENDDTALLIVSPVAPTVDAFQLWDNAFSNTIFAVTATGGLKATLPTSDPAVAGQLWNDGGTVVMSGSTAGDGSPPWLLSGAGTPVGTTPAVFPALYFDTGAGGGGLYINWTGDPTLGWFNVGGNGDQNLEGVRFSQSGQLSLVGHDSERVIITDVLALLGSGNGAYWNTTSVDGEQKFSIRVGNFDTVAEFGPGAGVITVADLPTADPAAAGQIWTDNGVLVLSGSTAGGSSFPDESGDGSPGFNSLDPTTRPIGHIYLDSTNGGLFGIFLNPSSGLHEWFQFGGEVAGDVFHEGFNTGNGIAVLGDTLPGGDRSATMSDVDGYNGSGNGFHWCTTGVDGEQFALVVTGPVGTPKFATFGGSGGPGGLALDGDLDMSSGGDAFFTSTGKKVFTRVIDIREVTAPAAAAANHGQLFVQDNGSGVSQLCVRFETGDIMVLANQGVTNQTYTESNVTTDRTYNANAMTLDEIADVLGTLIADLRAKGVVA